MDKQLQNLLLYPSYWKDNPSRVALAAEYYRSACQSQALTAETLSLAIREDPNLIQVWLDYMFDKRWDSGCYLEKLDDGNLEYGTMKRGVRHICLSSNDHPKVASEFLAQELDAIFGTQLSKDSPK